MKKYEVIIIGGGPAGAMTALAVARARPELAGEMLLLEARSFPREKICGGGVSGRVVDFLESLGVSLEEIPKVPVDHLKARFEGHQFIGPFGNGRSCVVRRSVFDALLLDEVRRAGVEVREAAPASGAFREQKGVCVIDAAGRRHRARVLVGADGVNGRSRIWFGAPHRSPRKLLLQADFPRREGLPLLDRGLVMDYGPTRFGVPGYIWFFPSLGPDGAPLVNAGITGGEFRRGSAARLREVFLSMLESYPEIKAMAPARIRFKAYPERDFAVFQPMALERVLFVGEQLGVDAFTGEGLSICADSAAAAALEIVRALEEGDFGFRGYRRRIMTSDFFPLLLVGRPFWLVMGGSRPPLMLEMATRQPPPGKENCLEIYTSIYSGSRPGNFAYTPYSLTTILRDLSAAVLDRLRDRGPFA
jgi:flavin-dependent dehydrogenase